jgi:hypothetical protein
VLDAAGLSSPIDALPHQPYGTFHIDMTTHLDLGPAIGNAEAG